MPPHLKPAFSTVACPEWTLDRVALAAQRLGFSGVELRTFGVDSRRFACDPALTSPEKVRRLFAQAGVSICSLATGLAFDRPLPGGPMGHVFADAEEIGGVREAQRAVDIANAIECPLVRVFGFRIPSTEKHEPGTARIIERLSKVIDHAAKTGVTVVLENGGSFPTAGRLMEIINEVRSPLLGACYNLLPAYEAHERPAAGIAKLGEKLLALRVKDLKDGRPCALGAGVVPVREAVAAAAKLNAWAIFEWDRAWLLEEGDIGEPEFALDHASRTLWQWIGATAPAVTAKPAIPAGIY
jgi:sugar phosphate isomerase/epimerase